MRYTYGMSSKYQDLIDRIDPKKLKEAEMSDASDHPTTGGMSENIPVAQPEREVSAPQSVAPPVAQPMQEIVTKPHNSDRIADFEPIFRAILLLDNKYKLGALFRRNRYFSKQDSPTLRLALIMYANSYPADRGTLARTLRDLGVINDEAMLSLSEDGLSRLLEFLNVLMPDLKLPEQDNDQSKYIESLLDEVLAYMARLPKSSPMQLAQHYEISEKEWLFMMNQLSKVRMSLNDKLLKLVQFYKAHGMDKATVRFDTAGKTEVATKRTLAQLPDIVSELGRELYLADLQDVLDKSSRKRQEPLPYNELADKDDPTSIRHVSRLVSTDVSMQAELRDKSEYYEHGIASLSKGNAKLVMLGGIFDDYVNSKLEQQPDQELSPNWEIDRERLPVATDLLEMLDKQIELLCSLITLEVKPLILVASKEELELAKELREWMKDNQATAKYRLSIIATLLGRECSRLLLEWLEILPLIAIGSSKDGDRVLALGSMLDIKSEPDFLMLTQSRVRNSDIAEIYKMWTTTAAESSLISDLIPESYYQLKVVLIDQNIISETPHL
ncbi:MAG: hypothetical protein QY318_00640 [Candidatus Dojkabacteria bacterium]|nr:MAG: hypothetical protein QY318_00640 [Candidatus Dojkabacteria bacterium]